MPTMLGLHQTVLLLPTQQGCTARKAAVECAASAVSVLLPAQLKANPVLLAEKKIKRFLSSLQTSLRAGNSFFPVAPEFHDVC